MLTLVISALVVPAALERSTPPEEPAFSDVPSSEPLVVLFAAKVPHTRIADHGWFGIREVSDPEEVPRWHRWEVWQNPGGPHDHVRHDLMSVHADVGAGGKRAVTVWRGEEARRLGACIATHSPSYPERHRYLIWPGPNSNTYITWMLDACGVEHALPWTFYGAWYPLFE